MALIAIPTFRRWDVLPKKTLAYLDASKVPRSYIYVFVQGDDEDVKRYADVCDGCNIVATGATGIAHQRRIIRNYFPHGSRVFMLDDDIERLIVIQGRDLSDVVGQGFAICESENVLCFSICGYSNDYYMNPGYTTTLKHSIGGAHGFIASPEWSDEYWVQTHDQFEDYEFVLRYFRRFGKTLRLNWAGAKTQNYGKDGGGLGDAEARRAAAAARAAALEKEFPGWVKMYEKKAPDGKPIANLRFNWRAKPPETCVPCLVPSWISEGDPSALPPTERSPPRCYPPPRKWATMMTVE